MKGNLLYAELVHNGNGIYLNPKLIRYIIKDGDEYSVYFTEKDCLEVRYPDGYEDLMDQWEEILNP